MQVKTKFFGEIELDEDKILTFEGGIMGFEEYKTFTLLYDIENKEKSNISWLQSIENEKLALPVISPMLMKPDYNPQVEEEVLEPLGELTDENIIILCVMTVPKDHKKSTANLKAPIIINADTRKGCQVIVENPEYKVRHNVYEAIQIIKKGTNLC